MQIQEIEIKNIYLEGPGDSSILFPLLLDQRSNIKISIYLSFCTWNYNYCMLPKHASWLSSFQVNSITYPMCSIPSDCSLNTNYHKNVISHAPQPAVPTKQHLTTRWYTYYCTYITLHCIILGLIRVTLYYG